MGKTQSTFVQNTIIPNNLWYARLKIYSKPAKIYQLKFITGLPVQ